MKRHNDENIRDIPKPDFSNFNRAVAVRPVCKSIQEERIELKEKRAALLSTSSLYFILPGACYGMDYREIENLIKCFVQTLNSSRDLRDFAMVSKNPLHDLQFFFSGMLHETLSENSVNCVMIGLVGTQYANFITMYLSKSQLPLYETLREMKNPIKLLMDVCKFIDAKDHVENIVVLKKSEYQNSKRRKLFDDAGEALSI